MTTITVTPGDREDFEAIAKENDLDSADAFVAFCWNQHIKPTDVDSDTITEFTEAYIGDYADGSDFAEQWALEEGLENTTPDMLWRNIDWDGVWDTDLRHDFYEIDGHFFRSI